MALKRGHNRDVRGTGFCGMGRTGTAKLFFLRDGTGIFGTAGQAKTGQNGIPRFFFVLKITIKLIVSTNIFSNFLVLFRIVSYCFEFLVLFRMFCFFLNFFFQNRILHRVIKLSPIVYSRVVRDPNFFRSEF